MAASGSDLSIDWRSDRDRKDGGCHGNEAAASPPARGFTSVYRWSRKRAHGLCEKPPADTEKELFSLKCSELQCYIQPLSSILRGLRSGRYSERLSSFQESVAMDRIQRIMGVLQNPNMGGRFLGIILKIEEMLQSWFPHIKPDLNHMDESSPAKKPKQRHGNASPPRHGNASAPPPPPPSPPSLCSSAEDPPPAASRSSSLLKRLHTDSPATAAAVAVVTRHQQEATQDNAVSSSTDRLHPPRGPPPFKIRSPCLERLLKAPQSLVGPRSPGDGGWPSS